ncbi:MAG: general secretion pathway protein GspK [Parvibaculaceae bacterium]
MKDAGSSERGLALVSVLWALSILSLLAVIVVTTSSLSYRIERNSWEHVVEKTIADAALHRAVLSLLDARSSEHPRIDGSSRSIEIQGRQVTISIQDELGKIDINASPDFLIDSLLESSGVESADASAMTKRIICWRLYGGAQRSDVLVDVEDCTADGQANSTRRGFQSIEELMLIDGMTPGVFARLEPAVTVYSGRPDVEPQNAPMSVLMALPGYDHQKADELISARSGSRDAEVRSLDGMPFLIKVGFLTEGRQVSQCSTIRFADVSKASYLLLHQGTVC